MNDLQVDDECGPIRVFVCDDADVATKSDWAALHDYALNHPGRPLEKVGDARCASEAIDQGKSRDADVILIDLVMPRFEHGRRIIAGPWIARALTEHYRSPQSNFRPDGATQDDPRRPAPRLLLWTSNPLETVRNDVHAFVELGGWDVVDKQATTQKQVETIRRVADGGERWQPEDSVSPALREALELLAAGFTQGQIAKLLGIENKAAESRVSRLRQELGVSAGAGRGAGPVIEAARTQGVSWVPWHYRQTPSKENPFQLAS